MVLSTDPLGHAQRIRLSPKTNRMVTRDPDGCQDADGVIRNALLKRDTDDANADLETEQQRMMAELVPKIMSVLNKYATENGFAVVLDISSQQTPVIFASNTGSDRSPRAVTRILCCFPIQRLWRLTRFTRMA